MRVHIGCASVYLHGYINLDVPSPTTDFACNRLDLVEKLGTTEDAYYARHQDKTIDSMRSGPIEQEYVCDQYGDFHNLPEGEIEEVLVRQTWEHLSITEAKRALDNLKRRMKTGALLRIDVPDHHGTLQMFRETGDEFYIRHLLGPRRNDYGYHMMSYTRERLQSLVEEYGFKLVDEEPNIHVYPAFCLRFVKVTDDTPEPIAPWQYVKLPSLPADIRFADIGPGSYPHPYANVFVDSSTSVLSKMPRGSKILSDLDDGLSNIPDNSFDYVWCSHVFEHLDNPEKAAAAVSRVSKRGTLVVPSAFKDAIFNWESEDHVWHVLPNPRSGGVPLFVRYNAEYINQLRDGMVQRATCSLYRNGTSHDCTYERHMQDWYKEKEVNLDVVVHWENQLNIIVIGE